MKIIFGFLCLLFLLPKAGYSQPFPGGQTIVAGEYFINTDPGEGNGMLIIAQYDTAIVNIAFNPPANEGDIIYVRFKSSNGKWSGARAIRSKKPFSNPSSKLVAAEYFIDNDPGEGSGNPVPGEYDSQVVHIEHEHRGSLGRALYLRFKDSNEAWGPARSILVRDTLLNSGSHLVAEEYFINVDPGIGNGNLFSIGNAESIYVPHIPVTRNDHIYLRVKDNYGRWSVATSKQFRYKTIDSSLYNLKFLNGDISHYFSMVVQPQAEPSAFYTSVAELTDSLTVARLDSVFVKFQTDEYIQGSKKGEKVNIFRVFSITPNRSGNDGVVTMTIIGERFQQGARVKLSKSGFQDIHADTAVVIDSTRLYAIFTFRQQAVGSWNVVVVNPDGSQVALPDAFILEPVVRNVWFSMTGEERLSIGRDQEYVISFGNDGNVDSTGIVLWIHGIPRDYEWKINADFLLPPPPDSFEVNQATLDQIPIYIERETDILVPVIIPVLRTGDHGQISITLKAPPDRITPASPPITISFSTSPGILHNDPTGQINWHCTIDIVQQALSVPGVLAALTYGSCIDLISDIIDFGQLIDYTLRQDQYPGRASPSSWMRVVTFSLADLGLCALSISNPPAGVLAKLISDVVKGIYQYSRFTAGTIDALESCWPKIPNATSSLTIQPTGPFDPNDKNQPAGFDSTYHYVMGESPLVYTINFENIGNAPAETIAVRDTLSYNLSLESFKMIGTSHPDVMNYSVDPVARFVSWNFNGINLPDSSHYPENQGWIRFRINPIGLQSGSQITNIAGIVFVPMPPIITPEVLNTIDASPPSSFVHPLESVADGEFEVRWTGTDDFLGSGIKHFDVYVRYDTGAYIPWLLGTRDTSAIFVGQFRRSHSFYSNATDNVGHSEAPPNIPDAVTFVNQLLPPIHQLPRDGAIIRVTTPIFRWSPTAGGRGTYTLQYSMDSTFTDSNTVIVSNIDTLSFAIPESLALNTNGTYYWRVEAIVDTHYSRFRKANMFIVDTLRPNKPILLSPASGSNVGSTPTFVWTNVGEKVNFYWSCATDSAFIHLLRIASTKETTYTVPKHFALSPGEYYWRVEALDEAGNSSGYSESLTIITDIKHQVELPREFKLFQNYPNPFNPITTIQYQLPSQSHVILKIYNVLGQEVKTLVDEIQDTGYKSVLWNSTNNYGNTVSSGVYFYRLQAGSFIQTKKLI
ncbi:MAG: T9SS type A sorting domain-containing protein, partial [Bacteroidota bacterium]|nr:T9SS type A sorting domain-containing protein [Bacteroidota bacterium]